MTSGFNLPLPPCKSPRMRPVSVRTIEELSSSLQLLSLRVLVRLRWVAVIGQAIAVLGVHFVLGFRLPLFACLGVIAASAVLNMVLTFKWPTARRLSSPQAGAILGYDIVQLAILLFLTGGLQNPFAFLFLVPVTISATVLPIQMTIGLGLLALLWASVLAVYHLPLPGSDIAMPKLPDLYVAGLWAAIVSGVMFSATYAWRVARETRLMASALAATEMVLAREQRLSALDGMAAAAAHELGTPLATITVVAKELKREMPEHASFKDDVDLLISQAGRCREILSRLANRNPQSDSIFDQLKLLALLEDLIAPMRGSDVTINVSVAGKLLGPEPVFKRNPGISYGLGNILENAVDFAETMVNIEAGWSAEHISLRIVDDGPGFDTQVLARVGEPFVTTRYGYGTPDMEDESGHQGMGLGLFIAKTLLERSGASVTFSNQRRPLHGAEINIIWPRAIVEPKTQAAHDTAPLTLPTG